jgi:hypothetical protein
MDARSSDFEKEFTPVDTLVVSRFRLKPMLAGVLALISAAPVALAIYYINSHWSETPEKAVKITGVMFAVLGAVPIIVYLAARRGAAKLGELGLIAAGTIGVLLTACYLFWASFYIMFPADVFIWSESDFVGDIVKFRQGYPIFTADVNNESFTYVPGTQLLTYFLAWLIGLPTSISAYRAIQVVYTLLAAFIAFLCCRRLFAICFPNEKRIGESLLWGIVWLTGLFLIATNSITNPFSHLLHNDALAQLFTVTAYWLVLEYQATKNKRILWLMAMIPALGFWVKQSLIIWAVLYCAYLIVFDRPRSFRRITAFAAFAFTGVFVSVFIGYALWQENFIYWVFTVLSEHAVSPLRSFRHLLEIWVYFAVGLIGGAVLLQDKFKELFGLWLVWLILISTETYTSGIAWMLNHIGPGCLIAGIWFFAALADVWHKISDAEIKNARADEWMRAAASLAVLCLLFSGFGFVRVPVKPFGADAERYVREIENEFSAQPPERTLLDAGTWIYMRDGIVMKDRAPSIGERGYSQTGDFSGILGRLKQKYYAKILVRNLHSPDFWYDHELWSKSSDIRKTLLENYTEVGKINAASDFSQSETPYGFQEISILVPRAE